MAHLDQLKESVRKIEERGDAFIAFAKGLAEQLRHAKNDAAEIERIASQLDAQAGEFDAAIIENTDTPTPNPAPTPTPESRRR
jgi:hypothetical protein